MLFLDNNKLRIYIIDSDKKDEKMNTLLKNNVKKSIDWCMKYGVLYNSINFNTNVFLDDKK